MRAGVQAVALGLERVAAREQQPAAVVSDRGGTERKRVSKFKLVEKGDFGESVGETCRHRKLLSENPVHPGNPRQLSRNLRKLGEQLGRGVERDDDEKGNRQGGQVLRSSMHGFPS